MNWDLLATYVARAVALLTAIPVHESAHAWASDKLGDPTAKRYGRLSLNPLRHFDFLGALCMIFVGFGWAKPVPIDPRYFKNKHRDDLLVSIAGITMNLIIFIVFSTLYYVALRAAVSCGFLVRWQGAFYYAENKSWLFDYLTGVMQYTAVISLSLAVFNLLPVPPLDGSHLFNDLFLKKNLFVSRTIARYGMGIVMVLSLTGILGKGLGFVTGAAMDGMDALLTRIFFGA